MEILQFLISYLLENSNNQRFLPIIELLKQNSFDVKKTVRNLNVQTVAPIIRSFLDITNNSNTQQKESEFCGTKPIVDFADQKIILSLNSFFAV